MERETLVALRDRDGDAHIACRDALLSGADFRIGPGLVPLPQLIGIYTTRAAITREGGIPTLGFAEALHSLRTCELKEVRLAGVTQHDPAYHFVLFLSEDNGSVIACIGVSQDPRFRVSAPEVEGGGATPS